MVDQAPPAVIQHVSSTFTPYPIIGALLATEEFLGHGRSWEKTNDVQRLFLVRYFARGRNDVPGLHCVTSTASRSVDTINRFLADHRFDIQLSPQDDPGSIYAASILDLLVEWYEAGTVTTVTGRNGVTYPAVRIGTRGCAFLRTPDGHIVVELATKTGERVMLTMVDQPGKGFALDAFVDSMDVDGLSSVNDYDGVIFPMVSLNQEVDISWLCGMHTVGEDGLPAIIAQALQQTKLRMNQFGARVESAAAVGVYRGLHVPKPDYIVDAPFVLWITRSDLHAPLFVGHLAYPDWKDPGDLAR